MTLCNYYGENKRYIDYLEAAENNQRCVMAPTPSWMIRRFDDPVLIPRNIKPNCQKETELSESVVVNRKSILLLFFAIIYMFFLTYRTFQK